MPNPSEEKLDIVSLIQGVIEVFNTDLKTSITFNSAEKEVFMLADKDQFVRVFNNLFKNAIQAIPGEREGKIVVDLAVEHGVMKVAIHDNGIGIPKQKHEKIFVPYFTTKSTGTGLGLAMIKQIIENHKGEIRFESALNLGTTFYIKLPIADR